MVSFPLVNNNKKENQKENKLIMLLKKPGTIF